MTTMYFILLTWFALLKIHYEAHSAILIIKGSAYQDSGLIQNHSVVRVVVSVLQPLLHSMDLNWMSTWIFWHSACFSFCWDKISCMALVFKSYL